MGCVENVPFASSMFKEKKQALEWKIPAVWRLMSALTCQLATFSTNSSKIKKYLKPKQMLKAMVIEILALILVLAIFTGSYFFYSSKKGLKSVYQAPYAWKIDFLAGLSGLYIMGASFYFYYQENSLAVLVPLFLFGAFQGMMHVSKWIVRTKRG